jgi:hypothetical protein
MRSPRFVGYVRLRRWAIALVAVTSLAGASACGSGDSNGTSSPGASLSSSDDTSTGSGDSSGSGGNGSGGSDVGALTAKTLGAALAKAATDAGSAHMVMSTGGATGTATISGDMAGFGKDLASLQVGVKMKIPGTGTAELRIVGSAFYMKVPGLSPGSKPWLKVPLDDPNNPLGSVYSQLVAFTDPDAIKASYSAFKKFTDVGSETVDGVDCEHYRVTVDTVKSLKASGLHSIGGLPLKQLLKSVPKQTTSDLWVDGDNQIIKMTSDGSAAAYEIHYSKWGQPVHVSAPPASQVQSLTY